MLRRKFRQYGMLAMAWLCMGSAIYAKRELDTERATCIVNCASDNVGERETHGANRSPWIDFINKKAKAPVGSPWCASAVNFWHWMCGVTCPGSAYSPNWFKDKDCYYIRGQKDEDRVRPGDCGGIYFPSKKRIAHIYLVESVSGKWVNTIEGNTNDEGSREGTRCMRRKRLKSSTERFSRFWE